MNSKFSSAITFLAFAGCCFSTVSAQQFRAPSVPGIQASTQQSQGQSIRGTFKSGSGSVQDFVPRTNEEGLGLVPVRPRNGNLGPNSTLQYRPDYSGVRSSEQSRIIDQIRTDSFDSASQSLNDQSGPQTIRQRYDNGKDQLVRQVIQDEQGNYYNHGAWRLYNRKGELMASGQFLDGAMDGTWERWHSKNSAGIFQTKPFSDFQGPYFSTATFVRGKLNGVWVISDQGRKKIVEVSYKNGKRHGAATWWYPNSERMRVVNFKDGELDGPMLQWNNKKELVRNDEFIRGQKVIRTTTLYRPKQRSSEKYFLGPELRLKDDDNWWDAQPAEYVSSGIKVQHGPVQVWHSNGQKSMIGQYRDDLRVGKFTWWHPNGQRSLAGRYENGNKVGPWTWWHDNGMRSIEGEYIDNKPVGEWVWWDKDGNVEDRDDFGEPGQSSDVLVDPGESKASTDDSQSTGEDVEDANPFETNDGPMEEIAPQEDISPEDTISPNDVPPLPVEDGNSSSDNIGGTNGS